MSNYSTNCTPTFPPTPQNLSLIHACQSAATSPFCWPPNNTRICAPSTQLTEFYWPQRYYHQDAKLALETDLESPFLLMRNNTGNRTTYFTKYDYERLAVTVPGSRNEKSLQVYMLERRFDEDSIPYNLQTYNGPTIILVKTAEFPSTTRPPSSGTTSTRRPSSSTDDPRRKLSPASIVGIVIGSVAGVALIVLLVFCMRRCARSHQKHETKPPDQEELERMAVEGEELMMVQKRSAVNPRV